MLKGDFSFVIYDKEEDTYFCARDPLGIKPLYYINTENGYMFSEDIDELLALPSVEKKPNLKSMRSMLLCQAVDYHNTMYENIYRLPQGCTLTIVNGKEQIERYWHPEKIEIDYSISEEEAAKKLRELFTKAVTGSISSLEETAFELSGGLDSSSVVSILAKKTDPLLMESYSLNFGTLECDESKYVDDLLGKYPLKHSKVNVSNLDYKEKYALEYLYTLSPNWPITITFAMAIPMIEKMKQEGKTVIVTGQGGDHLFTGTPYMMYDLFTRGEFSFLYGQLQNYKHPLDVFRDYIVRPLLGQKIMRFFQKDQWQKKQSISQEEKCTSMDASHILGIKNPAKRFDLDMITSRLYATLMDANLFHCMEKHFDIEYRHPFFDIELVEFVLSLPPEMKYRDRRFKWIWRKAMEGILPDKINQRTDKAEFSELIRQQIDALDLDEFLVDLYIVKLGLIDRETIDKYMDEYIKKNTKFLILFWTAINVEYWYRYNQFQSPKTV